MASVGTPTPKVEVRPVDHFIAGSFRPGRSGRTFETLNPATNRPLTTVAEGLAADVDLAVQAARRAFEEGPWPRMAAAERARRLRRVAELIEAAAEEIAELEVLDTGLPITQARGQAARAAENFRFFAAVIEALTGESYQSPQFLNYALRKPAGVAGLITPWNTPFMLETWKVAPCLAAGCTCVLKPAEWSPLTADRLARIVAEAEIPEGVFNVVHGFGESCGAPLVAQPGGHAQALLHGAGRQVAGGDLRRLRPGAGGGRGRLRRLLAQRGALHGWQPAAGGAAGVRGGGGAGGRARPADPGGRSLRPPDRAGAAHPSRPLGAGQPLPGGGPGRGPAPGRRWAAAGPGSRQLPPGHGVRGRAPRGPHLPGGDLRPGGGGDALRGRGGGGPPRQSRPLRPRRLRLDRRPAQGNAGRPGHRRRAGLAQLPERARPAHALRGDEGERDRPGGRPLQLRLLLRAPDRARCPGRPPHPAAGRGLMPEGGGHARGPRQPGLDRAGAVKCKLVAYGCASFRTLPAPRGAGAARGVPHQAAPALAPSGDGRRAARPRSQHRALRGAARAGGGAALRGRAGPAGLRPSSGHGPLAGGPGGAGAAGALPAPGAPAGAGGATDAPGARAAVGLSTALRGPGGAPAQGAGHE